MAFTRKMIKDAAKECGIESELPREFIDALMESHVEARDAYAETQVEAAKKSSESVDVKESEEYKALKKEYDDYKTEQEGKETQAAKEAAVREYYKSCSISEANLKIAMRSSTAEIAAAELDKDGKLKNTKPFEVLVKGDLAGLVSTTETRGAPTATPPANTGGTKLTKAEIYARDEHGRYKLSTAERQKALAENPELLN